MKEFNLKEPLIDYPWRDEAIKIIQFAKGKSEDFSAFLFDLCMSLAYIDSTSGIEKHIEYCHSCPGHFNGHLGFINLCGTCYEDGGKWHFQKATKPQSGAIGKLSSEMILKFVEILFDNFPETYSIGGTALADAMIVDKDGNQILAEVKSAPLLTYPLIVSIQGPFENHKKPILTNSQCKELDSALYLHDGFLIPLGKIKSELWPFKQVAEYLYDVSNSENVDKMFSTWMKTRDSYKNKDRESKYFYLANASGNPPTIAKEDFNWPNRESISDSKTSAGMDRTDDIKKGIYQVLKLGISNASNPRVKTALISNLPAYRHGEEYVNPFKDIMWGNENDLLKNNEIEYLRKQDLRYIFDYIITLTDPTFR